MQDRTSGRGSHSHGPDWAGENVCSVALSTALVAGMLVFLPTSARSLDAYLAPKETVFHIAAAVGAFVTARRAPIRVGVVERLLAASVVLGIASMLLDTRNLWWSLRAAAINVSALLIYWASRHISSSTARERVFNAAVLGLGLAATTVLLEAHGLIGGLSMPGRAPGGTGGNRNFTAHLMVIGMPLLLHRAGKATSPRDRLLGGVGFSLCLAAILLSRSRGAWLGAIAATAVLAAACFDRVVRQGTLGRRAVLVATLSVAGFGLASVPSRIGPAANSANPTPLNTLSRIAEYDKGTGQGRLIQYQTTLAMIAAYPWFGVGPGNWSAGYVLHARSPDPSYQPGAPQPVNRLPNSDLLGHLSERGMLGFLPLVAAVAFLIATALGRLRVYRAGGSDFEERRLSWLTLSAMAALITMGLVDAVVLRPEPAVFASVLFGMYGLDRGHPLNVTPKTRTLLAQTFALVCTFSVMRSLGASHAMSLADRSDAPSLERAYGMDPGNFVLAGRAAFKYALLGNCSKARDLARAARANFPEVPEAESAIAECERREEIHRELGR